MACVKLNFGIFKTSLSGESWKTETEMFCRKTGCIYPEI